jgi:hypothetical protein
MALKEPAHRKLLFSSCADLFRASTGSRQSFGQKQAWMAVTSTAMTCGNKRRA